MSGAKFGVRPHPGTGAHGTDAPHSMQSGKILFATEAQRHRARAGSWEICHATGGLSERLKNEGWARHSGGAVAGQTDDGAHGTDAPHSMQSGKILFATEAQRLRGSEPWLGVGRFATRDNPNKHAEQCSALRWRMRLLQRVHGRVQAKLRSGIPRRFLEPSQNCGEPINKKPRDFSRGLKILKLN